MLSNLHLDTSSVSLKQECHVKGYEEAFGWLVTKGAINEEHRAAHFVSSTCNRVHFY